MTVRDFLKQKAKRDSYAERQMNIRMRRALMDSLKYVLEEAKLNMNGIDTRLESLIDPEPIREALRWLYVTWGYQNFLWFKKNLPFPSKKADDFWLQELEKLFRANGAKKVTEILGTTLELATPVIKEALKMAAEGSSIDAIQKEIIKNLNGVGGAVSPARARMIARTEVIGASNQSTFEAVKSSGVEIEKKWLTGGMNIRPSHKAAEAQGWVDFNEPFKVKSNNGTDSMMHPGDPSGSAENVINCKCVLIFRAKE
jgi:Phage Mu protein F like protein